MRTTTPRLSIAMREPSPRGLDAREKPATRAAGAASESCTSHSPAPAAEGYRQRPVLGGIVDITDVGLIDHAMYPADGEHPGPLAPTPQERVDAAMRGAADEIDAGLGAGGGLFTALAGGACVVLVVSVLIGFFR